jgi:hypothetical protein
VEVLAEMADRPAGCCEVVRDGGLFVSNFSVTRSTVRTYRGGEKDYANHNAVAALVTRS